MLFIVAWSVGDIEQLSTLALSFDLWELLKWVKFIYCHFICFGASGTSVRNQLLMGKNLWNGQICFIAISFVIYRCVLFLLILHLICLSILSLAADYSFHRLVIHFIKYLGANLIYCHFICYLSLLFFLFSSFDLFIIVLIDSTVIDCVFNSLSYC